MKQVFTIDKVDQIYVCIEKFMSVLKPRLLPRLFSHLQQRMWIEVRDSLYKSLLNGQSPDYYEGIEVS